MHSLLLPETTTQRTDPLISCQVVYPTCVQASCTHHVPVFLSVDKWRVVLKGENPDYIHAANIKVGIRGHIYVLVYGATVCFVPMYRATSSREPLSSHRDRSVLLPETSGRWSPAESVVWLSCSLTSLNWMR